MKASDFKVIIVNPPDKELIDYISEILSKKLKKI